MLNQCIDSLVQKVQNGVVINFEKIGPDPPPITEKSDDATLKDENGGSKEGEFGEERAAANQPPNTSWYNCRRMIYVPRTAQKGYTLGENPTIWRAVLLFIRVAILFKESFTIKIINFLCLETI